MSNHTHQSKTKGGWQFAPKRLGAWACLLGKNGAFWKSLKHAFWPPPGCWESFSVLPRHALSSIMVWNAGCWAMVGSDSWEFKCHLLLTFAVDPFQRNNRPTLLNYKQHAKEVNFVFHFGWANQAPVEIHFFEQTVEIFIAKKRAWIPSSVVEAFAFRSFPAKRESKTRPSPQHPRPPTKCPQFYCKHPW